MQAVILTLFSFTAATQLFSSEFTADELESNPDTFHELLKQWDQEVEEMEQDTYDLWAEEDPEDHEDAVDLMDYFGFAQYMNFTSYLSGPMVGQQGPGPSTDTMVRKTKEFVKDNAQMRYTGDDYVDFNAKPEREKPTWAGILPQIGRNLFSMIVADLNNTYISHASLVQWLLDAILWLFLPVIGGFMGIATFISFESDKLTYHHMGLDQSRLYQGEMLFIKGIIYSAMGRPDFYKNIPDRSTYVPKRDLNPEVIPETVTEKQLKQSEIEKQLKEAEELALMEEEEVFDAEVEDEAHIEEDLEDAEAFKDDDAFSV